MKKLLIVLFLLVPSAAWAIQVKVCYNTAGVTADTVKIQLWANTSPVLPDVLAGSTITGALRCGTYPFPAALVRGQDFSLVLKAENALQEVGPASNAISFHSPNTPAAITGFTLSIIVP